MIPLDIHLDRAVSKSREARRCNEVIATAEAKIRSRLKPRRGRKPKPQITPMQTKAMWANKTMDQLRKETEENQNCEAGTAATGSNYQKMVKPKMGKAMETLS